MSENRDSESYTGEFLRLIEIMRRLRSENGCEWDRAQTHESLRQYLIEEAYEAVEAIDKSNMDLLREELGDLMLHVIFHAKLGEESGSFSILDVLEGINDKLIKRHPHVFDGGDKKSLDEIKMGWEEIKRSEGRESLLEGIPDTLPALQRSFRLQEKAASSGFDWKEVSGVWDKISEEIEELHEAIENDAEIGIEEEIGDLLFSIVNLSRFMDVNPEDALRRSSRKFEERFKGIEESAKLEGREINELSLDEMDKIWESNKTGREK